MKVNILIRTPEGCASKTSSKIKLFLFGKKHAIKNVYINDKDSEMVWEIEGSIKTIMKIQKNVAKFDVFVSMLFKSKFVKKAIKKYMDDKQEEELNDMLKNQTEVIIIKDVTADELTEYNTTWWENIKHKFNKVNENEKEDE